MDIELKAAIAVIVLSFAVGAYAYHLLPESVASHWNADGDVDGHLPAFWGAFLMPLLSVVLFLVFLAIPRIDPLRANIEAFKKDYHRFIAVILGFLFIVHLQSLLWNLGTEISFSLTMPVLLGGLLFFMGGFLGKAKRNWFIGIRTPWTMTSDEVWERTHALGGKLFKGAGVVSALGVLFPANAFLIAIGIAVAASIIPVAYSYFAYRELARR